MTSLPSADGAKARNDVTAITAQTSSSVVSTNAGGKYSAAAGPSEPTTSVDTESALDSRAEAAPSNSTGTLAASTTVPIATDSQILQVGQRRETAGIVLGTGQNSAQGYAPSGIE